MRGLFLLLLSYCSATLTLALGQVEPPPEQLETLATLKKAASEASKSPVLQKYLVRFGEDKEQFDLFEIDLKADPKKWKAPVTELVVRHHDSGYFGTSLPEIANFSKLRKLEFHACSFDKEGGHLSQIANGCPELEELSFHSCWFDRPVIRLMATFPKVKKLDFGACYVGDGILSYAKSFPNLESITLFQSGAADREADQLAKLRLLRVVDIQECAMTAKGIRSLASLKPIKHVFASDIDISDEEAENIQAEFGKIECEVYGEQTLIDRDKRRR